MKISAKADYAVRAALELAHAEHLDAPTKAETLSNAQEIPSKFLETILVDLRRAGIVRSQRGALGGYWLARPADEVSIADVIRAVDGPLAYVRGERAEQVKYEGAAEHLVDVWVALRARVRGVLDTVTLADVLGGDLSSDLKQLVADPASWASN